MAGFIRRYDYNPGNEVITQIEGLVIIDNPQPGNVQGATTGFACVIGEFADMTYATVVDGNGNVLTKHQPVQVFSAADLQLKAGIFDVTLGNFGRYCGNGFAELANKTFSQLALIPINLSSPVGARLFRDLPPGRAVTDPTPFVPATGAVVQAGVPFRASAGVIKSAKRVSFTNLDPITQGTLGSFVAAGAASTQTFLADVGFDWTTIQRPDGTLGARKGDVLCIGFTNGSAFSNDYGTYRVQTDPVPGNAITIEKLDGSGFPLLGVGSTPWRLHFSSDADTAPVIVLGSTVPGGYDVFGAGGYNLPVRPITDSTGAVAGVVPYVVSDPMTPVVTPTPMTPTFWDPLSGLNGLTHPVTPTAYDPTIQASNVTNSVTMDTLYGDAINTLVSEQLPAREVDLLWCARKSATIRSYMYQHAINVNQRGISRLVLVSPPMDVVSVDQLTPNTYPGVGVSRSERQIYCWPGVQTLVSGAQNQRIKRADGSVTTDGVLDVTFDGWVAALLSVLRPELDAGQAGPPVPAAFAGILAYQSGLPVELGLNEYILMKSIGVCDFRMDRNAGPIIQSAITTSLISGQTRINRRRMADYIEDSLANRLVMFVKNIGTRENRDSALTEVVAFLEELRSSANPSNQRILEYSVNDKEGNTPELEAQGIYAITVRVRMLPIDRYIVLNVQVGESVNITSTL